MQGETGRKTVDGSQPVAVEQGGMMVARLHHQEQVQRIGIEAGSVRQAAGLDIFDVGRLDVADGPAGRVVRRTVDEIGEGLDLRRRKS